MADIQACYTADYAPIITDDLEGWAPVTDGLAPRSFPKGTLICQHYGKDRKVNVIRRGLVTMSFFHENGTERVHFLGGAGYVFGFRSCLSGRPYGGALTALTDVGVYQIPSETVMEAMLRDPVFFRFTMYAEYRRGLCYSRKLEMLALPTSVKRVAALLLSFANRLGSRAPDGVRIPLRLSQELIAKMLYTDRVTISRAVAELEHRGLLRHRQGSYTISDPEKLTAFIGE